MSENMTIAVQDKTVVLNISLPVCSKELKLVIKSDRNNPVVNMSDVSRHNPCQNAADDGLPSTEWLPVVDVEVTPNTRAEMRFALGDECSGSMDSGYAFNSHLWPKKAELSAVNEIPADRLLNWENILYIPDKRNRLESFSVVKYFPNPLLVSKTMTIEFGLLTDRWSGEIEAYCAADGGYIKIGSVRVDAPAEKKEVFTVNSITRDSVMNALNASVSFMLSCKDLSVNGPFRGGFNLFYDLDGGTYRNPCWPWGYGPVIKSLSDASDIPEIAEVYGKDELEETALRAGQTSLKFRIFNEGHIADGVSTSRFNPNVTIDGGTRERLCSVSDGGFLCGWAWIPLYEKTGRAEFLSAGQLHAATVERLLAQYGVPPQDFMSEENKWTEHTLDESGFGTEAFDALYRVTGDEKYAQLCERYIDNHIARFERPDGLWERACYQNGSADPTIYMTRGLGWSMEGLLAAHNTLKHKTDKYLQKAVVMAEHLMAAQQPDGAWNFCFNEPREAVGIGEKGTALWALLFYKLYGFTGDACHLNTGRKALLWCMNNQRRSDDKRIHGSVPSYSPQSAIVYRPWFEIACVYTSAFFALALMEELKIRS